MSERERGEMGMGRLIAIGDIHGSLSKLKGLLDKIHPNGDDKIVFLGDYVDRRYSNKEEGDSWMGLLEQK